MVHIVDSNKSKYSIRQYSSAKKACTLQDVIGRPSTEDFIRYVEGNMIPNCDVILRVEDIFGLNLGSVKGKTTRHLTEHVNVTWTQVPIIEKYCEVTLAVDIMAINKLQFMITISRDIHFGTAKLFRDNFIRYVEGNMIPNFNIILRV